MPSQYQLLYAPSFISSILLSAAAGVSQPQAASQLQGQSTASLGERYRQQLEQLSSMGFFDRAANIQGNTIANNEVVAT